MPNPTNPPAEPLEARWFLSAPTRRPAPTIPAAAATPAAPAIVRAAPPAAKRLFQNPESAPTPTPVGSDSSGSETVSNPPPPAANPTPPATPPANPTPTADASSAGASNAVATNAAANASSKANSGPDGENVTGGPTDAGQTSTQQPAANEGAAAAAATDPPESANNVATGQQTTGEVEVADTTATSDPAGPNSTAGQATADPAVGTGNNSGNTDPAGILSGETATLADANSTALAPPVRTDALASSVGVRPAEVFSAVFNARRAITAQDVVSQPTAADDTPIRRATFEAAAAVARAVTEGVAPPAIGAAADALLGLGRTEALSTFADAIAGFAHESAAVGTLLAATETRHYKWEVTLAVLGVDTVLAGHWYAARRRAARAAAAVADPERPPFSTRSV